MPKQKASKSPKPAKASKTSSKASSSGSTAGYAGSSSAAAAVAASHQTLGLLPNSAATRINEPEDDEDELHNPMHDLEMDDVEQEGHEHDDDEALQLELEMEAAAASGSGRKRWCRRRVNWKLIGFAVAFIAAFAISVLLVADWICNARTAELIRIANLAEQQQQQEQPIVTPSTRKTPVDKHPSASGASASTTGTAHPKKDPSGTTTKKPSSNAAADDSPYEPPPWLPADSPNHPVPDQFMSRMIRGDRNAAAPVAAATTMHAFLDFTCETYYRHTYEFVNWPEDLQGRRMTEAQWAEQPNIPRSHILVNSRYIAAPYKRWEAQTPYYWHIKHPMVVFDHGAVATPQGSPAWMGPAVCRAGEWDGYFRTDTGGGGQNAGQPHVAKGVSIAQVYSAGYYHFMGETFTRLAQIPRKVLDDPEWKILLNRPPQPSSNQAIECLGINAHIVELNRGHVVVDSELIVPAPGISDVGHPNILARFQRALWGCHAQRHEAFGKKFGKQGYDPYRNNWLRPLPSEQTGSTVQIRKPTSWKYTPRVEVRHDPVPLGEPLPLQIHSILYMHRDTRAIANEDELLKVVQQLLPGVPLKVHHGDESFEATADLFSGAELIIGPHGAGMTNLFWALPGAIVIEIMSMAHTERMYHHYAEVYGLRHYFVTHEPSGMRTEDWSASLRRILGQAPEHRLIDIEEGVRRRVRLDSNCTTEAEEYLRETKVI